MMHFMMCSKNKFQNIENGRSHTIDMIRGFALLWMTCFHAAFDANYFGWLDADFRGSIFWTAQRSMIVGLFILCAGYVQALAIQRNQSWKRFFYRWSQIVFCSGLVTVGSIFIFPESYIYFGVLHGIAVMLILVRCLLIFDKKWILWLALLMGAFPYIFLLFSNQRWIDLFGNSSLLWVGLSAKKPNTEDFLPIFPWLGVMLLGAALAFSSLDKQFNNITYLWTIEKKCNLLVFLGRHSLMYYMLHQLVLFSLFGVIYFLLHGSWK